jgi:hypothetical protein
MSQLGIGAMLGMFSGNGDTVEAVQSVIGKLITALSLDAETDRLTIEVDGAKITMQDEGQSCCERRYMRTDDTLADFIGAEIRDMEIRSAEDATVKGEWDEEHDIQFLVIITDRGNITFSNHNEHNGYYGGFWITASKVE